MWSLDVVITLINWKIYGKSFSSNSRRLLLPPEMNLDPCLGK
jgi:hypothetical protein